MMATKITFTISEKRKEYLKEFYTEKGVKLLENRLKVLIDLRTKIKKYPCKFRILDLPTLYLNSESELNGRIMEIKDFLMILKIEVNKDGK